MLMISKPCCIFAALFFLLFSGYCCTGTVTVCPQIEKQALLSFKQSVVKDPYKVLSSWNGKVSCCKWEGVVCSNLTGHVLELQINGDIEGRINSSLINLKHLRYLNLGLNSFDETIPSFIGSFKSLEYLDLSYSGNYGVIPHSIGNLSNLRTLLLETDDMEPARVDNSLEWLSGLSKLEHLNMNHVDLGNATNWAQVINNLPSLVDLQLNTCNLNFTASSLIEANISSSLAHLDLSSSSVSLDLSSINAIGPLPVVPRWIFQLSNLTDLYMSGPLFEGPIPTISRTTKLQNIDLSGNHLNSSIPEWLYVCKYLKYVDFSSNYLQNEISSSIGNLTSLVTLDLSYNYLSGNIPREIASLCRLRTLDLSYNKLEGQVSDSFGNMSDWFLKALESLYLRMNQLSGHLTHQFGEFKSLRYLDLTKNSLLGKIPNNIGNISSIGDLILGGNRLTGNLPESVGMLRSLGSLNIEDNMLQGVVTENHFANLSNLYKFRASGNHLTLKVGKSWSPPSTLRSLELGSWSLGSGTRIPSWLQKLNTNISVLNLSRTGISGNVPIWFWGIPNLLLSHNQLGGKIPDIINATYSLYLSYNLFTGLLPRVENVLHLDLSNNRFSGGISHFLLSGSVSQIKLLDLEGNELTGELTDSWDRFENLEVLNLRNNNFSGHIPNSIGRLTNLVSLSLHNNKLSGRVPFSMQNCTRLVKIDLGGNDLNGNLPRWIGSSFSDLTILILGSNKFSGEITSDLCFLKSLQILDLSNNIIYGTIPSCVNNFTAMATKRSLLGEYGRSVLQYSYKSRIFHEGVLIFTKGIELIYSTTLPLYTNIDLSQNNLSGDIPKEITSLVELISLNLSGNSLTGLIPDTIGNMKQLESLDFSRNSLSGEIPNSFTVMTSLSYLNLSYNNLTGKIPQSTQISILNNSSFFGNNLCGPPLTVSCSNEGEVVGPKHDESRIEWLYVFISLGYSVGLSAVLSALYLKKTWREAYYDFLENTWDGLYVYFYIRWRRLTRAFGRST